MQATPSIHFTKVSLFPTSFTRVPASLHSCYFLSLEMQRPVQHFIRDSFPQAVLPAEHPFSSIDTHLTLAYVQKPIKGKKNKNKKPKKHFLFVCVYVFLCVKYMLHKRCHITFAVKQFCNEEGPFLKGEEHAQMLIDLTVEGTQLFAVSGQQLIFIPLQKPDREPSKTYSSFLYYVSTV